MCVCVCETKSCFTPCSRTQLNAGQHYVHKLNCKTEKKNSLFSLEQIGHILEQDTQKWTKVYCG